MGGHVPTFRERGEGEGLRSGVSQQSSWLLKNGPRELELLFRAIAYHPSAPILILDNERNYCDASTGAGKLLGSSRDKNNRPENG